MIKALIKKIEEDYEGFVTSGEEYASMPHDIDVLIKPIYRESLKKLVVSQGFVTVSDTEDKLQIQRFYEGKAFFIDIAFSLQYLQELFPETLIEESLLNLIKKDKNVEKFFRYLYLLRSDKKNIDFITANFNKYQSTLFDKSYIKQPIFRDSVTVDVVQGIVMKKFSSLVRGLTLKALFSLIRFRVLNLINRIGSGSITAFIGPDGSGKSTIIEKIMAVVPSEKIYMGDWGFVLQPLYNKMHNQHIFIARLTYPFFYVENWFRYIHAWWLKMSGVTVFTDRYPGLNRHLRRKNIWLVLNDALYWLFPSADKYIFISAAPEVIHGRKSELTVEEIFESQNNLRQRLKGKRFVEVVNDDIDECLNEVLRYIYSK